MSKEVADEERARLRENREPYCNKPRVYTDVVSPRFKRMQAQAVEDEHKTPRKALPHKETNPHKNTSPQSAEKNAEKSVKTKALKRNETPVTVCKIPSPKSKRASG